MKIFIDIGHPAHVHYFRNFIKIMERKGHNFFISARDKEVTHSLLNYYQIEYTSRGLGRKRLIGKFLYLIEADYMLFKLAKKFQPDIFLSFGSTYAAHTSFLLRKPHISFYDTEHALLERLSYAPFTNVICTPINFRKNFGKKQLRFDGSMDLAYLHPKYFSPNKDIYKLLGLSESEKYIIMRFVSWAASHDLGQTGVSDKNKLEAVKRLSLTHKIFISSENELPTELKKFKLKTPIEKIHDVLYYADLFWGESGTMATEAAILGTPAITISSSAHLQGVFDQFVKEGLLYIISDNEQAIKKAIELLKIENLKANVKAKAEKFIQNKIDLTKFMVWFVENYPNSFIELQANKD